MVLDADDTLWATESLYEDAREACLDYLTASGIDAHAWSLAQSRIDLELVATLGLSPSRFPTSCLRATRALIPCLKSADERAIIWLAESVFRRRAPLNAGVEHALTQLADLGQLHLLTKGDPAVQLKRIHDSGLGARFERIVIAKDKTVSQFARFKRLHDSSTQWLSVGNSLSSDVLPAIDAGMRAIWLRDVPAWEFETIGASMAQPDPDRCIVATDLCDVVRIVQRLT